MTIVSLNIWGGRAGAELLLNFFKTYRDTVDIFCLQEVWADYYHDDEGILAGGKPIKNDEVLGKSLELISDVLPDHIALFHPCYKDDWGNALFVRKSLVIKNSGDEFVHQYRGYIPHDEVGKCARNIQFVTIETVQGLLTVVNLHGLWNGEGKGDSADRLQQSERIVAFTKTLGHPFILIGDFNLTPDTTSIAMLEEAGMQNLITQYNVTDTRTSFYTKAERYADYAFVSNGVTVQDFRILPEEVSDHAALLLEIVSS